MNAEEHETRVC